MRGISELSFRVAPVTCVATGCRAPAVPCDRRRERPSSTAHLFGLLGPCLTDGIPFAQLPPLVRTARPVHHALRSPLPLCTSIPGSET